MARSDAAASASDRAASAFDDTVDLRLAESYTPLCMCAAKCAVVCILHTTLTGGSNDSSSITASVSDGSMRAHLASATLLVLDALVIPYRETIVNTNAVAWAILIAFMSSSSMLPLVSPIAAPLMVDGGRQQQLLQSQQRAFEPTSLLPSTTPLQNPTTTESSPSSSILAFITLLWCVVATAHMTYGGVPLVHSNPSMAFWPAVMMKKPAREAFALPGKLSPREAVACILTTLMVATTCDHRWHHNFHTRRHWSHEDLMAGICFRSCAYAILSCMWSYTVVALTRPNSSSGSHVAMTTAVLTATRFMPILYMPSSVAAGEPIFIVV